MGGMYPDLHVIQLLAVSETKQSDRWQSSQAKQELGRLQQQYLLVSPFCGLARCNGHGLRLDVRTECMGGGLEQYCSNCVFKEIHDEDFGLAEYTRVHDEEQCRYVLGYA